MMEWKNKFTKVLAAEMEERKEYDPTFSQYSFAYRLGISPATLTQLLKGKRNPSLDTTYRIAKELNCSIDYLVGLTQVRNREWNEENNFAQALYTHTGLTKYALHNLDDLANEVNSSKFKDCMEYVNSVIEKCYNVATAKEIKE